MRLATLVDATELAMWASRRDAQAFLPELIRRLIHGTLERVLRAGFRAGEGVQLAGWDGVVAVEIGNAFVPDGTSVWELGTGEDVKTKADDDYGKRTNDPLGLDRAETAFVFVTPRRWSGKEAWINTRMGEGLWRDVRAYDADDLEQWLALAPAVHHWLSLRLGKHPEGAVDLETCWADWSETTQPAITPEVVLAGRAQVVEQIHAWLRAPSTPLALQADDRDEAVAIFAAALHQLPAEERSSYFSRTLVVAELAAWQHLTASRERLILVQRFDSHALARAGRAGHRVVVPLGRADAASSTTVVVPRLAREEAVKALVACGLAEERARDLAMLGRRSMTSFRRKLAVRPEVQQPEWGRPAVGRSVLPAMLAGGWNDACEGDRKVIAALAQQPYDQAMAAISRWSHETDPPVRRVESAWFVVSKEDAWGLLARYLTRADLAEFEKVALDVLATPDPRFDLADEQQYMAGVLGHVAKHSQLLREGIADTLALLGARGEATSLAGGVSAAGVVKMVVRRLLERANSDWRVWASLAHARVLARLAEAAPDEFLDAIEAGVAGDAPILLKLFNDRVDPIFSSSPHTGLLWALETLAWNVEHLGRAGLILAKLARLDPGGKLANRPQSSLRSIFLPWYPQTSAPLDRRLGVLDLLREREPDVTAKLLRDLLPEAHSLGHNNPKPQWREWAPDRPPHITRLEYVRSVREVTARIVADAGASGTRWVAIIDALHSLPEDQRGAIVERLRTMDLDQLAAADRSMIWTALRRLISHHRSFPDADWALPAAQVDQLANLYQRFEPTEPIARYSWLFTDWPDLPDGREGDYEERRRAIAHARNVALRATFAKTGVAGLLELVGSAERPYEVGLTLGQSDLVPDEEDRLLQDHLGSDDPARAWFARGFATGRMLTRGREWIEMKYAGVARAWSPAQRAELLHSLPCDRRTWELAESADPDTTHRYWRLANPYAFHAAEDVEWVARRFLEHGRPYAAVDVLAVRENKEQPPSATLIADALELALRTSPQDDPPMSSSFSDHVGELLDMIDDSTDIAEGRLAAIEWALLPLFRHDRVPKRLHAALGREPAFFVDVLAMVFRAEGEERREPSAEEQERARRGYDLLQSWRTVPGTREDGEVDAEVLTNWIEQARAAASGGGRVVIADQTIGQMLSGSPAGADGSWPHRAVRDVIECVASTELEHGFAIGVANSRGIFSKSLTEGGVQERALADRYAGFAAVIVDRWPRTAATLRRIADQYRADAEREDREAELREDLEK